MKRLAALSFHPAFTPPSSGGELRLYHLFSRVANHGYHVELMTPTYGEHAQETVRHGERFLEHRFPKTKQYNAWHRTFDRIAGFAECSGLVCSLACKQHGDFARKAREAARQSHIFVHEYAFLTPLVPRRAHRKQLFVYDAHNLESQLARDMFGRGIQGRIARARIHRLEAQLVREADIITTVSEEEGEKFVGLYGADRTKLMTIPNGVDIDIVKPCPSDESRLEAREIIGVHPQRPAAFFIGSYHPPNIEAVEIIARRLAVQLPDVEFLIAGKVCQAFEQSASLPANMRLMGLISEEEKQALLHGADVALNPMMSGSGTNLKMLEFLAAGLPILCTPVGARGIGAAHRRHAMIATESQLLHNLEELLTDSALRASLAQEARALAEQKFSWDAIGERLARLYDIKTGRRIIILNDYRVIPAEQGGQVRVEAVAKTLRDQGLSVSIVSLTKDLNGGRTQLDGALEELSIPRSRLHKLLDMALYKLSGSGADDVSALIGARRLTPRFQEVFRRELRTARAVMLSHPYMEAICHQLPKNRILYYDSHNTEYDLKQKLYKENRISRWMIERVKQAELAAVQRARRTFCVSEENRGHLLDLEPSAAERMIVSPNGVDCHRMRVRSREERVKIRRKLGFGRQYTAIFLGSGHPPNAEAARLITERLARDHPRVLFLMVGSVCGWFWNKHLPGNVLLMGLVSSSAKDYILQVSDFALNPMLTGSGTSLKLFDYMAAGLPVLSTEIGARGLNEEEKQGLVLLQADEFSHGLRRLIESPEEAAQIGAAARKLAEEKFDWGQTLKEMRESIAKDFGLARHSQ